MKNKSSSGPDKISNKLLKMIIDPICIPLCYLFNLSFKSGIVPTHFKTAKCVPVFKSGDTNEFSNYRPISLLSSFAKLQEKLLHFRL